MVIMKKNTNIENRKWKAKRVIKEIRINEIRRCNKEERRIRYNRRELNKINLKANDGL
jgi:hypothetical protein